jgi:hypothetical protein
MPLQNTGQVEIEVRETNPKNPNFGKTRWIPGGQDTTRCPVVAQVGSDEISETVYRDDCVTGVSTGVVYTLPANSYYASTKYGANALARAYYDSTGKQYARANAVCQSKTVSITNKSQFAKGVRVTVTRTDSQGQLVVRVFAQANVDDGTGSPFTAQNDGFITIPDGQTSATGNVLFFGAVVQSVELVEITSTVPATYTF